MLIRARQFRPPPRSAAQRGRWTIQASAASDKWWKGALEAPLSSSSNNRRGAVAELTDQRFVSFEVSRTHLVAFLSYLKAGADLSASLLAFMVK